MPGPGTVHLMLMLHVKVVVLQVSETAVDNDIGT